MKYFLALVFFLFLFASCEGIQGHSHNFFLSRAQESPILDSSPLFCSNQKRIHKNKVLFVIDKTKTNNKSDPEGLVRIGGMRQFISENKDKNTQFSFISFGKEVTSPLTINQIPVFRSNTAELELALEEIAQAKDEGPKDYSALLPLIQKTIENDRLSSKSLLSDYYIVFISDGHPSVSIENQNQFIQGMALLAQSRPNLHIHTAYYGQYKNRGQAFGQGVKKLGITLFQAYIMIQTGFMATPFLMNSMGLGTGMGTGFGYGSEEGEEGGPSDDVQFVNAVSSKGEHIDYNKGEKWSFAQNLEKTWNMKNFLVYNLNAGFCLDGEIDSDSDADGLCDRDEEEIEGFSVDSKFSFNDGYGDYFHFQALSRQTMLPPCSDRSDRDFDLLTACEEKYLNSLFRSSSLRALSPLNPDSDGDGVIDGIEAMIYLADEGSAPLNPSNLMNGDLERIKRHLSPFNENEEGAYDTMLMPIKGEKSSCYGIQQRVLPLYSTEPVQPGAASRGLGHRRDENKILIYSIQKAQNSEDYIYQFTYHSIKRGSEGLLQKDLNSKEFYYLAFKSSPEASKPPPKLASLPEASKPPPPSPPPREWTGGWR